MSFNLLISVDFSVYKHPYSAAIEVATISGSRKFLKKRFPNFIAKIWQTPFQLWSRGWRTYLCCTCHCQKKVYSMNWFENGRLVCWVNARRSGWRIIASLWAGILQARISLGTLQWNSLCSSPSQRILPGWQDLHLNNSIPLQFSYKGNAWAHIVIRDISTLEAAIRIQRISYRLNWHEPTRKRYDKG